MSTWTLDSIDWSKFDRSRVAPDVVRIVKASALVEYNGGDYATYLCNVFADDPAFQASARAWAVEEIRHGEALARWASLADPDWDFATAAKRFTEGFRVKLDAVASVRGSRSGELIARCMVETGTSSYYSALADHVDEPVLRQICRKIAADEFRHYKLFYGHLQRYLDTERMTRWQRFRIGIGRIAEVADDELAFAYFAANAGRDEPYNRRAWSRAYACRAYRHYGARHIERGMGMALRAVGLRANGRLHRVLWPLALRYVQWRAQADARPAAA
jgi:rubrerythrin